MKRIVLIILLVSLNILTYGQTSFKNIVKELEKIGYSIINDGKENHIKPEDNWYNSQIRKELLRRDSLDTIQTKKIISIKCCFIKGNKEILPKTYGRADIQEWTFVDSLEAKKAFECISKNNFGLQEKIHKAPWTVWRNKNKLYFILTGGTYMIGELKNLKRVMEDKINNGG